jgi:hypothetical protein
MSKTVAQVNSQTGIVENLIIVDDGDVMEGYLLIDIPNNFYSFYDKKYLISYNIIPHYTKWSAENGFTDLDGNSILTYMQVKQ